MSRLRTILFVIAAMVLALPSAAQAPGRVAAIEVQGNQRIEADTIRSYMLVQVGEPADADRLDRSLRALFATGLFRDVEIRPEGNRVVVTVRENPIVNRVGFEGNRRVTSEALRGEVQLRARSVFTPAAAQSDRQRILEIYARRGRFGATVEPKIIELDQNRVDVVFEITEGDVALVARINFVGNENYSDSRLKEVVATREQAWYRLLSTSDTYDPDRLAFDRELLRRFYLRQGYGFAECMATPAVQNKLYLFFATRQTAKVDELDGVEPLRSTGRPSSAWARWARASPTHCSSAACRWWCSTKTRRPSRRGCGGSASRSRSGSIRASSRRTARAMMQLVTPAGDWDGLSDVQLVVESVFEDVAVKQAVLARLEEVCPKETILATNTSTISLDLLADGMSHPERLVGMHFFNPAQRMPLVEVIRHSDDVAAGAGHGREACPSAAENAGAGPQPRGLPGQPPVRSVSEGGVLAAGRRRRRPGDRRGHGRFGFPMGPLGADRHGRPRHPGLDRPHPSDTE